MRQSMTVNLPKQIFFGLYVLFSFVNILPKIAIAGHQPLKYTGREAKPNFQENKFLSFFSNVCRMGVFKLSWPGTWYLAQVVQYIQFMRQVSVKYSTKQSMWFNSQHFLSLNQREQRDGVPWDSHARRSEGGQGQDDIWQCRDDLRVA